MAKSGSDITKPEGLVVGEALSEDMLDMVSGASFAKATWKKGIFADEPGEGGGGE